MTTTPVLRARGLVKRYGHVTALDGGRRHRVLLRESWSTVTARITRMPVMSV